MAKKDNKTIMIKGSAMWAKVWESGEYNGQLTGYSIQVAPDEKEKERVLKALLKVWETEKDEVLKDKNFKLKDGYLYLGGTEPDEDDEDQTRYFKAKRMHEYKDRLTGEMVPVTLPIFDAYGDPMPKGTLIGNGSIVTLNVLPTVYAVKKDTYGVSLKLNALQVNKLVEYKKDASSYGFEKAEHEEDKSTPFDEVEF